MPHPLHWTVGRRVVGILETWSGEGFGFVLYALLRRRLALTVTSVCLAHVPDVGVRAIAITHSSGARPVQTAAGAIYLIVAGPRLPRSSIRAARSSFFAPQLIPVLGQFEGDSSRDFAAADGQPTSQDVPNSKSTVGRVRR